MDQVNYFRCLFTFSSVNLKVSNGYYLNSIQIVTISSYLSQILSIFLQTLSPVYLMIGVILPIYLGVCGVKAKYYWECFSALMVFRRFIAWMAFLDVPIISFSSS